MAVVWVRVGAPVRGGTVVKHDYTAREEVFVRSVGALVGFTAGPREVIGAAYKMCGSYR